MKAPGTLRQVRVVLLRDANADRVAIQMHQLTTKRPGKG